MDQKSIKEQLMTVKTPWDIMENSLTYTFKFEGFLQAIDFVNKVAQIAQEMNHHPDIDIRYSKVTLTLSTHDVSGVTEKDISLAKQIDLLV